MCLTRGLMRLNSGEVPIQSLVEVLWRGLMVSVMRVLWRTSYGKSTLKFQEFQEMLKSSGSLTKGLLHRLMRSYGEAWAAICPDPVQI